MRMTGALAALAAMALTATAMGTSPEAFRAALAKKVESLGGSVAPQAKEDPAYKPAVKGEDGFYFLTSELRSYAVGRFWGDDAAKAGVAEKNQDPLPAILDFHNQCRKAGVALILVPVPGKVVVYADKLDPSLKVEFGEGKRLDAVHREFYDVLEKEGVKVVDLTPMMLAMRKVGGQPFCKTDTHWSPKVVEGTPVVMWDAIRPFAAAQPSISTGFVERDVEVVGDLASLLGEKTTEKLKVSVAEAAVESDEKSPVVLAGDSHALVYRVPELLAKDGGLAEQLAARLGVAPDVVAAMGSGANASRMTLARRRDNLAGKKVILWVFTAREFTEATQGWLKIPVVK